MLMTTSLRAQTARPASPLRDVGLWALPVVLLIVVKLVNPIGYTGGGGDDWHYLEAARCAAAHGPCLPQSHWWARFPLVLPMAAAIVWLGEGHISVALAPALYSVAVLLLLAANVRLLTTPIVGAVAASMLTLTPIFAHDALQPLVDRAELAWVLAALLGVQRATRSPDGRTAAMLAGVAFGIAMMTRMTAITYLPIAPVLWRYAPADRRWLAAPAIIGLAGVLAAEATGYWIASGSPLHGWQLSLHHTRTPTTELMPGVDLTRSPILNLDYIRGWRRAAGISIHWSVDPLINLLAHPLSGLPLAAAMALAVVQCGRWSDGVGAAGGDGRWPARLALAGAMHFALLTCVLAIDPKPRMFQAEMALAATIAAGFAVSAWQARARTLPVAIGLLLLCRALILAWDAVDLRPAGQLAHDWVVKIDGDFGIDDSTRRIMTLDPAIAALPDGWTHRSHFIALAKNSCVQWAQEIGPGWRIERAVRFDKRDPAPIAWLRERRIMLGVGDRVALCLFNRLGGDRAAAPLSAESRQARRG